MIAAEQWLDKRALAERFACSLQLVDAAVAVGIPHAVIFGRAKFRVSEVERWLDDRGMEAAVAKAAGECRRVAGLWMYAVQSEDGNIKLGVATNPRKRLAGLQTGNASELRGIAAWTISSTADERSFHAEFAAARIRGEWFRPLPSLIARVLELGGGFRWGAVSDASVTQEALRVP